MPYEQEIAAALRDLAKGQTRPLITIADTLTAATQAEMEAGTETALRSMSPLRVSQAISALGGGGGDLLAANNLSDLANAATARTNLGIGNVTNHAQTQAAVVPNTAPSAGQVLAGNAGGTAYAPVSVSGDATLASTGALTIANDAVTFAKMQDVAGNSVLARAASGSGNVSEVALGASELLGRGSTGNVANITLGSGLSMSGTTLSATGGGGGWTSGVLFRVAAATEIINNSTAETSCFSGITPTVPAGTLGTAGIVRFAIDGQLTNTTGANQTLTVKLVFGGVTYFQDATANIGSNASSRGWRIHGELVANNSTSSQRVTGIVTVGAAGAVTTGYGDLAGASLPVYGSPFGGNPAEDSTADKTLDITLTASTASASFTVTVNSAYVTRV